MRFFVFISVCVFNVWPKATLLPVWPRDTEMLVTPVSKVKFSKVSKGMEPRNSLLGANSQSKTFLPCVLGKLLNL